MKLHGDKGADALYLRLDDSRIIEPEEVPAGVVLDFNECNERGIYEMSISDADTAKNLKYFQVVCKQKAHFADASEVVGIEILNLSKRVSATDLREFQ